MNILVDILIVTIKTLVWGYSVYCGKARPTHSLYLGVVSPMINNISPKSQWLFPFQLVHDLNGNLDFSFYCVMLKSVVYFSLCPPRSSLTKHRSDSTSQPTKWKIQKKSVAIYTRTWLGGIHLPRDISKEVPFAKPMWFNVPLAFPLIDLAPRLIYRILVCWGSQYLLSDEPRCVYIEFPHWFIMLAVLGNHIFTFLSSPTQAIGVVSNVAGTHFVY